MKKAICLFILTVMIGSTLFATVTFSSGDGGSNRVELGYGIMLNKLSDLHREWKTAHDTEMPVDIIGTTGVTVVYESGTKYSSGGYQYNATLNFKSTEDVSAVEVIILVFDIWGQLLAKLTTTEIREIKANESYSSSPKWNISSEHKASEALSSLAYVNQVRTKSGKIYTADLGAIAIEAQKFANDLTPEEIKKFT